MGLEAAIGALLAGRDLRAGEMAEAMRAVMSGQATPAQIAGLLVALRMKGETVEEIAAAARVLREFATPVRVATEHLVDTCGTGGDCAHTFNISTASAFVVAAAGGRVAKHGNRSVSSACGSADVLEAAGARLDLGPEQVARCIEEVGIGFLFAPVHHGAMRHALAVRRELGVRTLFNLLGPLTNPAGAPNQLIGVYAPRWLEPLARVLKELGGRHVLVVHGHGGLDELSVSGPSQVCELEQGELHRFEVTPEQFGLEASDIGALVVRSREQSLALLREVLANIPGPARDVVCLNAGAALYAAGLARDLREGLLLAQATLAEGKALRKFEQFIRFTREIR